MLLLAGIHLHRVFLFGGIHRMGHAGLRRELAARRAIQRQVLARGLQAPAPPACTKREQHGRGHGRPSGSAVPVLLSSAGALQRRLQHGGDGFFKHLGMQRLQGQPIGLLGLHLGSPGRLASQGLPGGGAIGRAQALVDQGLQNVIGRQVRRLALRGVWGVVRHGWMGCGGLNEAVAGQSGAPCPWCPASGLVPRPGAVPGLRAIPAVAPGRATGVTSRCPQARR